MDPNNEIRLLHDFLSKKYPDVYADYNKYLQSVIVGIENGVSSLNTPNEDEATSSPPKKMLIKRKAIAKDTPSGVERYAQSQKVDININAGNTKSILLDTSSTIMRDPPVLERTTKAISVIDEDTERIVKPFHQFCIQDNNYDNDVPAFGVRPHNGRRRPSASAISSLSANRRRENGKSRREALTETK